MGLIINQRARNMAFPDLLERLGITTGSGQDIDADLADRMVQLGGPVETGRGFVLHTSDYASADSTLQIDASVSLTATVDILRDIAIGTGPDRSILALGYASWAAGQLESEFANNGWLHCPADPELVFSTDLDAAQALGRRIRFGEVKINGTSVIDLTPTSTQSFWGLSGVGGHGNAEVFRMFTGSQIVGVDHTDVPI